jgi:hypothetical protein
MSVYRISPIAGGNGFKVHVADQAGGLRVVGVFPTETDAEAWITTDHQRPEPDDPSPAVTAAGVRAPLQT